MGNNKHVPRKVREKGRGLVPAGAYGQEDREYTEYLEGLEVVRPEVRLALASTGDNRFREFLARLGTTRMGKSWSLPAIAKTCGIGLDEFQSWAQKAGVQRAIALAQNRAPKIVADLADDAERQRVCCERCDGLGFVGAEAGWENEPPPGYRVLRMDSVRRCDGETWTQEEVPVWVRNCPVCGGERTRLVPGSEHARDRILEAAGIRQKGAGMQIVQNFGNVGLGSAAPRLGVMTIDVDTEGELP